MLLKCVTVFFCLLTVCVASTSEIEHEVDKICEPVEIDCACGKEDYFKLQIPMCITTDNNTGAESCQACDWEQNRSKDQCSDFLFCETCSAEMKVCLTCPEGRHGKLCENEDITTEQQSEQQTNVRRFYFRADTTKGCVKDIVKGNYFCFQSNSSNSGTVSCQVQCVDTRQNEKTTVLECDMKTGEWSRTSDEECEIKELNLGPKNRKRRFLGINLRDRAKNRFGIISDIFGGKDRHQQPPPVYIISQPPLPQPPVFVIPQPTPPPPPPPPAFVIPQPPPPPPPPPPQTNVQRFYFRADTSKGCVKDIVQGNYFCFQSNPGAVSCQVQCVDTRQNEKKTTVLECNVNTGEWSRTSDEECEIEELNLGPKNRKRRFLGINLRNPTKNRFGIITDIFGGKGRHEQPPPFVVIPQPPPPPAVVIPEPPPPPPRIVCPNLVQSKGIQLSGTCFNGKPGDTCNFQCDDGYVLSGPSTTVCAHSGQWIPFPPVCSHIINVCPTLRSTEHIKVNGQCESPLPGHVCSFDCAQGLNLAGPNAVTCAETGEWEPSIPICHGATVTNLK